MIEVAIEEAMRQAAIAKLDASKGLKRKKLNRFGSEPERTYYGYLGEQLVMKYLGITEDTDDYEYDVLYKGYRLDIKSISCKFKPPVSFLCTVNSCYDEGEHRQDADFYVFARVKYDFTVGWILGFMHCGDFFRKSTYLPKGSVYEGMEFFKANANIIPISKLEPMRYLKEIHEFV
ncbi:hypothetical protein [uncultured Pontibacter sp.]|uniref:hypothetical protein n=1 Tax=uncultured Pontibacter sp. TaxID=453356 RepID=UPI002626B2CC|nr:hypothetical protein [uncultured Pontibacter sp.]